MRKMSRRVVSSLRNFLAAQIVLSLALLLAYPCLAQKPLPVITLDKVGNTEKSAKPAVDPLWENPTARRIAAQRAANPRAAELGYRDFGPVRANRRGDSSELQNFSFHFHATTQLMRLASQGDFQIVPGGSCAEGRTYQDGDQCTVAMRFAPTGPGHRTGKLILSHSASARPLIVPTGGDSYASVVSFLPATITTVPATVMNGLGNFHAIYALAIDGGNNLYIPDYVANTVSYLDSSGILTVVAGGGSNSSPTYSGIGTGVELGDPYGVAADYIGNLYIADERGGVVRVLSPEGEINTALGGSGGSISCTFISPCNPVGQATGYPTTLATDPSGNLYVALNNDFSSDNTNDIAEVAYSTSETDSFYYLQAPYGDSSESWGMAADAKGNLYTTAVLSASATNRALCAIYAENEPYTQGSTSGAKIWPVAGTRTCGYSGDDGPATGAEIGDNLQQFALDAAGDFYFTDALNYVVRRIDAATGIIHTIAGLPKTSGFNGDGGPATSATLGYPSGIAVDSEGNVYIGDEATSGDTMDVREIGGAGQLVFAPQILATASAAKTILVTNTGNAPLNLYKVSVTSGNTTDFSLDPVTTNCSFTTPLDSGAGCKIGVIFKPTAIGSRSAGLTLIDDTLNGSDLIEVRGVAGTTAAKAVFSPASVTFPVQTLNTTSAPVTVTLANSGGLPLNLTPVENISGPNAGDFEAYSTSCGFSLAPGASCQIFAYFAPTAPGAATASLTLASSLGTLTLPLAGTGYTPIKTSVSNLNFGTLTVGTKSQNATVVVTNTGASSIPLTTGASIAPVNNYVLSGTCHASLPAGGTCNLVVGFDPVTTGSFPAVLSLGTSAGPIDIPLTGTSTLGMSISPGSLVFPPTVIDTASPAQVVTILNSGSIPLTLAGLQQNSKFLEVGTKGGTCTATLAPGKSCTYNLFSEVQYVGSGEDFIDVSTGRGDLNLTVFATGTPAPSTVAIKSSSNPAKAGSTILFNSEVESKTKALPTGVVELMEGKTVLAKAALVSGKATFDLSNLTPGTHTLASHYLGDKQHNPSSSSPIHQVIRAKNSDRPAPSRP